MATKKGTTDAFRALGLSSQGLDPPDAAKRVAARYMADEIPVEDAARQIAELLGVDAGTGRRAGTEDEKFRALRNEMQILTSWPCAVTVTLLASCVNDC